jgi:hypothetical protein
MEDLIEARSANISGGRNTYAQASSELIANFVTKLICFVLKFLDGNF